MKNFLLFFVFFIFFFNCQNPTSPIPTISSNVDSLIIIGDSLLAASQFTLANQSFHQAAEATIHLLEKKDSIKGSIYYKLGKTCLFEGIDSSRTNNSEAAEKQFNTSIEHFETAIQLLPDSSLQEAYSHSNINYILNEFGHFFKKTYSTAIEHYKKAIKIKDQNGVLASSYHEEIGILYQKIGEYTKSLHHYEKAITSFKKEVPSNDLACTYIAKSEIFRLKKQFTQAITQLEESKKNWIFALDKSSAPIYTEWGNIYHDMGKFDQAILYYQRSLDTLRAHRSRIQGLVEVQIYEQNYKKGIEAEIAKNLNNLGNNYTKLEKWDQAKDHLFDALELKKNLENKKSIASSYNNIGEFYLDQNQLDSALVYYQNAINLVTDAPILDHYMIDDDNLPTTESLKNSINQPKLMIYLSDQARCLEQYSDENKDEKYLEKAYLTYQKINELCHIILDNLTEESQFVWIEQVRDIYEKAIDVALRLHHLNGKNTTYLEGAFTFAESNKAVILYRTLQRHYAQQNQRPTNILSKIQQQLTKNDLLLEYFVGKDSAIYVFQITEESIELSKVLHSNLLKKQINDFNLFVKDGKNTGVRAKLNPYQNDAYGIYQALVQPFLKDNKRLIIVPDEDLNYVTFAALLTGEPQEYTEFDYGPLPYLIKKYKITYGYSTAMLLPSANQKTTREALGKAIIYAPTFTKESGVDPLPNTLDRVRSIGEKYEAYIYTGNVTVQDFRTTYTDYSTIYFATHAIADMTNEDSSYIIFSDSVLSTPDIYQLKMNEKLVIIGACESGNGKTQTGEGVMNLTRAFLSVGSTHVISSLWSVRERPTSKILSDFFQFLEEGNDKYNALDLAQNNYIDSSFTAHPFYWAAFTHSGHWQKAQKTTYLSPKNLIIGCIILGFGLFLFRKKR